MLKALTFYNIKEYGLKNEDYLVGRKDKHGNFFAVEVIETVKQHTVTCYKDGLVYHHITFGKHKYHRCTERKGADLPTIAKQTGHQSLQTLNEHYLNVSDETVDRFL